MNFINVTNITEFILIGFPGLQPRDYGLIALFFLLVYLLIVTGNSFILIIVAIERHLQKPQYLIFCILALTDIAIATVILPKAIARYWAESKNISFYACFSQLFLVHLLQQFSSLLMMIMALDRYVAIGNPLRYRAIIKNFSILTLCGLSWLIVTAFMVVMIYQPISSPYCSVDVFQTHCDYGGVVSLACNKAAIFPGPVLALFIMLGSLTFIVFSYTSIIISVMKIINLEGRYKTFSTCSPQLFIICLYYLPRCFNLLANILNFYISEDMRIGSIMLYTFVPPIVNPFLYCLRTKEVKEVLVRKLLIKKINSAVH